MGAGKFLTFDKVPSLTRAKGHGRIGGERSDPPALSSQPNSPHERRYVTLHRGPQSLPAKGFFNRWSAAQR